MAPYLTAREARRRCSPRSHVGGERSLQTESNAEREVDAVEVVAKLFVRPPPAIEVAHRGAAARTLRPRAGSLLLLLARQARCAVPPAPSAALSLTLPIYSAWRRRDDGDVLLSNSV